MCGLLNISFASEIVLIHMNTEQLCTVMIWFCIRESTYNIRPRCFCLRGQESNVPEPFRRPPYQKCQEPTIPEMSGDHHTRNVRSPSYQKCQESTIPKISGAHHSRNIQYVVCFSWKLHLVLLFYQLVHFTS